MENNKSTYQEVEKELNEYKELLWQLSDEYRLNLGNAEKELQELKEKFGSLENKQPETISETGFSFIGKLGLPACILSAEGKIIKYNNKFKFLIELMSFEIEDVQNITYLLNKDTTQNLTEKFKNYLKSDNGLFQSLFKVRNSFQGLINLILRIYKFEEKTESLALFIELHQLEIQDLAEEKTSNSLIETKNEETKTTYADDDYVALKTDIVTFAEKYEVYSEILKLLGGKSRKIKSSAEPETIRTGIIKAFAMEIKRIKLLEKLDSQFKNFATLFSEKYPNLTNNEKKHCMLIKAGLTYKEIASLMDISINGVKIARNRLRKKLDLENETKTGEFISQF